MTRPSRLPSWIMQAAYLLARPVLLVHFAIYSHAVRAGIYPDGPSAPPVEGPRPARFLFVGDIAVSGFGVLHDGMAVPAQTAASFAADTARGASWTAVSTPSLRAEKAPCLLPRVGQFDATVIMLGIADVLLVTRSSDWAAGLRALVAGIHDTSGSDTRVVFAAIPPMQEFRPIAPLGRAIISGQIMRLNAVTARVADELGAEYVPFPEWRVSEMLHEQVFSFRAMHRMWAHTIAPALVRVSELSAPALI